MVHKGPLALEHEKIHRSIPHCVQSHIFVKMVAKRLTFWSWRLLCYNPTIPKDGSISNRIMSDFYM